MSYIFFYVFTVLVLALALLSTSFLCSDFASTAEVSSSYECGFEPMGSNHVPFCIKFFLLAIIFIVFDVEISFLVPSLYTSILIFSFTLILLVGLLYEYSYGGLSWVL